MLCYISLMCQNHTFPLYNRSNVLQLIFPYKFQHLYLVINIHQKLPIPNKESTLITKESSYPKRQKLEHLLSLQISMYSLTKIRIRQFWGFCILPWIKMLNYTSNSTKLS